MEITSPECSRFAVLTKSTRPSSRPFLDTLTCHQLSYFFLYSFIYNMCISIFFKYIIPSYLSSYIYYLHAKMTIE